MVHESGLSVLTADETDPRVFETEMWVQSVSSFFELEHLPMSTYEREHASLHNYRPEASCIKAGLERLQNSLKNILGEDHVYFTHFMTYLESMRVEKAESSTSLEGQISNAIEHIQDCIRIAADLSTVSYLSLQTYLSFGRMIHMLLEQQPALGRLFKGKALPRLSEVSKESLQPLLKMMRNYKHGNLFLSIIMIHFKILKYLQHINGILTREKEYPSAVSIFSLVHRTWMDLETTLQTHSLPDVGDEPTTNLLEGMMFSSRMELRKVMELELVDINLLLDPQVVHGKLEDSQGICRDLFQQNIINLISYLTGQSLSGEDIFPYYQNRREQSVLLLTALTDLEEKAKRFTEEGSRPAFGKFMQSMSAFHSEHMKFLMYKDWGAVDRFFYDLKGTESLKQKEFLAHQLLVFLQTLIGEVKKRSVLQQ